MTDQSVNTLNKDVNEDSDNKTLYIVISVVSVLLVVMFLGIFMYVIMRKKQGRIRRQFSEASQIGVRFDPNYNY